MTPWSDHLSVRVTQSKMEARAHYLPSLDSFKDKSSLKYHLLEIEIFWNFALILNVNGIFMKKFF